MPIGGTNNACDGFDISTDQVRQSERFDYFSEVAGRRFLTADYSENWSTDFSGRISVRFAGRISIATSSSSPGKWVRTQRSASSGEESIIVTHQRSGLARMVGSYNFELKPGSVAILPTNIAYERQVLHDQQRLSIKLPRSAVETALRPGQMVRPILFEADDPVVNLLISYVEAYLRQVEQADTDTMALADRHIADLVALAVGAHRDAQAQIADGGLKAARTDAILKAIASSHAAPMISPATIGSQLGVTERHVHRLLEETNRTFHEHLLEARLSAAHRMLSDVRTSHLPVAEIAARSGFTNITYFNRMFRIRFGDTPTGVRKGSA